MIHQILHEEPKPPRKWIATSLAICRPFGLQRWRKTRLVVIKSAQKLADDLRSYLGGKPMKARPIGIAERGLRGASETHAAAASSIAVAALIMSGSLVAFRAFETLATRQPVLRVVVIETEPPATRLLSCSFTRLTK